MKVTKYTPRDEFIAKGLKKVTDNVTETAKTIGKHKERPEPSQHIDKDPPMRPRSTDPYSMSRLSNTDQAEGAFIKSWQNVSKTFDT